MDVKKEARAVIDDDDIRQIVGLIEALDQSSFDFLQLDSGRFKLTLGKGGLPAEIPSLAQTKVGPESKPLSGLPAGAIATDLAPAPASIGGDRDVAKKSASAASGMIEVCAPVGGLFYSKPDPSSPPFVLPGSKVDEGTTVGLIEVMKVFNAVAAGVEGEIAEVCVENGETVEMGQALFRIHPTK